MLITPEKELRYKFFMGTWIQNSNSPNIVIPADSKFIFKINEFVDKYSSSRVKIQSIPPRQGLAPMCYFLSYEDFESKYIQTGFFESAKRIFTTYPELVPLFNGNGNPRTATQIMFEEIDTELNINVRKNFSDTNYLFDLI
jgi:hypothetical protein